MTHLELKKRKHIKPEVQVMTFSSIIESKRGQSIFIPNSSAETKFYKNLNSYHVSIGKQNPK